MRHFSVWVVEFFKLLGGKLPGGQRLHPLRTACPICGQMVRLHADKAGRRHVFAHARALYEGSHYPVHYAANMRCLGSGVPAKFDPHPNESQQFKLPSSLIED